MYSDHESSPATAITPPGAGRRRNLHPLDAVIYLPTGLAASARWRDACAEYCQRRRYRIVAVVSEWRDLARMIVEGQAAVAVVGRRDHLPRDRTPRLDVVTEQGQGDDPTTRRPRRLM